MRLLIAIILVLFWLPVASADVTLPWSTSFDCADWTQGDALVCDDLDAGGGWTTVLGSKTTITAAANRPGSAGKGARFYVGDGENNNSGTIQVNFPTPQKELYISWWMRYESGFTWSSITYDKWLYIYTQDPSATRTSVIPELTGITGSNGMSLIANGTTNYYQVANANYGWSDIYGAASDGSWFHVEVYLKMDTDQTDGVGMLWVNNTLICSGVTVDWSNGYALAKEGWDNFTFENNQKTPNNGGDMYVDYDDMYVGAHPRGYTRSSATIGTGNITPTLGNASGYKATLGN